MKFIDFNKLDKIFTEHFVWSISSEQRFLYNMYKNQSADDLIEILKAEDLNRIELTLMFKFAVTKGYLSVIKILTDRSTHSSYFGTKKPYSNGLIPFMSMGQTILMQSIYYGYTDMVFYALSKKVLVEPYAIYLALRKKQFILAEALLTEYKKYRGLDPNILDWAVASGSLQITNNVIDYIDGFTEIEYSESAKRIFYLDACYRAIEFSQLEIFKVILEKTWGFDELYMAGFVEAVCMGGKIDFIRYLSSKGAELNSQSFSNNALIQAVMAQQHEMASELVDLGASVELALYLVQDVKDEYRIELTERLCKYQKQPLSFLEFADQENQTTYLPFSEYYTSKYNTGTNSGSVTPFVKSKMSRTCSGCSLDENKRSDYPSPLNSIL